ncbi:DUF397 domain-containing protein [Embleya sp. NPDC050493]|uniref:DUF397 domain-containing protein n=1 Tax=Embleya sp. NPDC050493 TaxID=3363989 RepID=UPI0037BA9DA5
MDVREGVNGAPAASLGVTEWVKSAASSATGQCVELGVLPGGGVAVRNSRDPQGPALVYTTAEVAMFVAGAKAGEFDRLLE